MDAWAQRSPARRPAARLTGAAIAALLLLAARGGAQEAPPPVFTEVIEVRVVNLEAVVTDRSGTRVTGLGPDDFVLRVDGAERPIDFFTEIRGGRAVALPGEVSPYLAATALEAGPVGTHYLIFIDDAFAIGAHRDAVLRSLERQLEGLEAHDRVAVVAFDGRRLELLTEWTQPGARLAAALRAARGRDAGGLHREAERRMFGVLDRSRSQGLGPWEDVYGDPLAGALSRLRGYAARLEQQLDKLVSAVVSSMRALPPPEGRRALLLLSGGWPYELIEYAVRGRGVVPGDAIPPSLDLAGGHLRGAAVYQPIVDTANLLGYTVYPVDVPGIAPVGGVTAAVPADPRRRTARLGAESAEEASLLFIARETGGRALLNSLRTRALESAREDTRDYYWLGFTATRFADDFRYRVRLEARRPELSVRARRSFMDFSRAAEVEMLVESGLLFGQPVGGGELTVEAGEWRRLGRKKAELPVRIGIPVDEVTFLPVAGEWIAELRLSLGVMDRRGSLSDIQTLPVRLRSASLPAPGGVETVDAQLTLWRERHELVVTVRDVATGAVLSRRLRVEP